MYLYDEALIHKLKNWTVNTQVNIYGPEQTSRMFEVIGDKTEDSHIQLPLIAIRRNPTVDVLNPNKKPLTYDGLMLPELSPTEQKMMKLSAIPINISYQIDVYCRYMKEADVLMRSLVFNIINHPTLEVLIPYNNINLEHNANIRLASGIEDNSDIPERFVPGQFTRLSANVVIDDAYLWDARERDNLIVSIEAVDAIYTESEN
jgi:hypothetical protein